MMDVGDKGVFAVLVVMMNFGDRGVFVRMPIHPDTLFFWAFYDRCSSFFTGNSARSQNATQNVQYDACKKTCVLYGTRADKTNLTEHPIYRKLTQRIYFMITGIGQNFNDKIKALCE